MTARELIAELQQYDPEMIVVKDANPDANRGGDVEEVECSDLIVVHPIAYGHQGEYNRGEDGHGSGGPAFKVIEI